MREADHKGQILGWVAAGTLVVACGTYAMGIYLRSTRPCGSDAAGNLALFACALSVIAAAFYALRGIMVQRSARSWVACAGAISLAAVMYFFVGVMYIGCGGV